MFQNAVKYYGNGSVVSTAVTSLKTFYMTIKQNVAEKLVEILGSVDQIKGFATLSKHPLDPNNSYVATGDEEDEIRCICGMPRDEGVMIQCSRCLVWQHIECTKADADAEDFMCERCEPREVNYEITLEEFTDEGYQYYLTLMRGKDLQIRQGDTVYVLRDIPMTPEQNVSNDAPRKHTYETIGSVDFSECDIFRVERLWKDKEGKRFVFGHHYLRPHETFHEPTRKFYPNEVLRVPLYEVVQIELIIDRCWVLDPQTFCKGRPLAASEPHVYICELRVDKSASAFSKISQKHAYQVCTQRYAFHKFEQKLKIYRTYAVS
jgi:[histone H3]-lysine4 N-trimethyltransferase ASH1L